nr:hypothetical protein [Desulfitibacter alkalitolerans]
MNWTNTWTVLLTRWNMENERFPFLEAEFIPPNEISQDFRREKAFVFVSDQRPDGVC